MIESLFAIAVISTVISLTIAAYCKRLLAENEVLDHRLRDLQEEYRQSECLWRKKETKQFEAYARLEETYLSLRSKLRDLSK